MSQQYSQVKTDFGTGPVLKCIVAQALPLTLAQFAHLLYNVVDRIYLGHMEHVGSMALTGVGLSFPIVTLILAFTSLFGVGGVPLFSLSRGAGDEQKASRILGTSFALLCSSSLVMMLLGYLFCRPILFAFGAGEQSYVYARDYLYILLIGTPFSMLTTGLNGYINAQGFAKTGMLTTVLGSVVNILLDPIFIFTLDMGVKGAALATIISQAISAIWVLHFLTGKRALIPLGKGNISLNPAIIKDILRVGAANFVMQGTNCLVQVVCNSTLQRYGGDLYISIMTVLSSVREVFMLPVMGLSGGAQPVIGFNYGAGKNDRVKKGIRVNALLGAGYTLIIWLLVMAFPRFWFGIFSDDAALVSTGAGAIRIYFCGLIFMAFQSAGQSTFQALADAKHAITFALLRKAIVLVPLALILPGLGFGVNGVFMAEPISDVVGGLVCFTVMMKTVYKKL